MKLMTKSQALALFYEHACLIDKEDVIDAAVKPLPLGMGI